MIQFGLKPLLPLRIKRRHHAQAASGDFGITKDAIKLTPHRLQGVRGLRLASIILCKSDRFGGHCVASLEVDEPHRDHAIEGLVALRKRRIKIAQR